MSEYRADQFHKMVNVRTFFCGLQTLCVIWGGRCGLNYLVHPFGPFASDCFLHFVGDFVRLLVQFVPIDFDDPLLVGDFKQNDRSADGERNPAPDLCRSKASQPNRAIRTGFRFPSGKSLLHTHHPDPAPIKICLVADCLLTSARIFSMHPLASLDIFSIFLFWLSFSDLNIPMQRN